jgi:predicted dehydrogenase
VRGDNTPLLTIHGTDGTIIVAGDGDEPQIQMASLRLLAARRNSSFEELAVPRRYVRTPHDLAAGAPASVGENYLSMAAAGASPPSPGFNDAVALHMLLDLIRLASATGERQAAPGPQPGRLA